MSADPESEGPYAGREGFFRSRWVEAPSGVEQLEPTTLAPGFRAGGVHCGLKGSGRTDLGLMVSDAERTSSVLLLTRNAAAAAPVRVCRELCEPEAIRAVIVNSGNANAATGEQGYGDAVRMRDEAAAALGLDPSHVAIAETGVIGVPLDVEAISGGIAELAARASEDGGGDFSDAILTTDKWPKRCAVRLDGVTVSAQAKGAGMIEPGLATMLCFIQTDAVLDDAARVRRASDRSFERISVDGQMSTNDTVLVQASGESGRPLPEGLLEAVMLQLALEVVADGEGATRVGKVTVTGAAGEDEAERVVRAIGNSPLVKTALFGRDANWGRISQATGMALSGEEVGELGPDRIDAKALAGQETEAEIAVRLDRGAHEAHLYFSDLNYEYIRINAEYTT